MLTESEYKAIKVVRDYYHTAYNCLHKATSSLHCACAHINCSENPDALRRLHELSDDLDYDVDALMQVEKVIRNHYSHLGCLVNDYSRFEEFE